MFKNSFSDLGHKKDAKEWQMMVLPVHPKNAELLKKYPNCRHCMSEKDILGLTTLHIQIREEIRLEKLVKGHRSLEVTFPLARNNKRKALQMYDNEKGLLSCINFGSYQLSMPITLCNYIR